MKKACYHVINKFPPIWLGVVLPDMGDIIAYKHGRLIILLNDMSYQKLVAYANLILSL